MVESVTISDPLAIGGLSTGLPGGGTVKTPMQMLCDICPIEKSLHWVCWLYSGLYWLLVEFPAWLADLAGVFDWLVYAVMGILVIIIIIVIGLVLTEVAAVLEPLNFLHQEPMFRAGTYVTMGMLMLLYHVGFAPWWLTGLAVGIIAFIDGNGILPYTVLGLSFWVGISWAIVMVLFATIPLGMLAPFGLAFLALGPTFGLPWDWFEDSFNLLLGAGLVIFVILCFYPSIVPGFETILKFFDYLLTTFRIYDMPCT